jgi:hypothetical protein
MFFACKDLKKDLLNFCMPMNDVQHHFLYGYGRLPCSMLFMFCFNLGGKVDVSFTYIHKIWQIHQGGNKRDYHYCLFLFLTWYETKYVGVSNFDNLFIFFITKMKHWFDTYLQEVTNNI